MSLEIHGARLSDHQFTHLARLVEQQAGIRMPAAKRNLLEGRLRRRLRERGMNDFGEYCHFLFDQGGLEEELVDLIDAVTTNKTEFFREPKHFEILTRDVLGPLVERGAGLRRPLRVWSAGSSIGAEAYTLAMVLAEQSAHWPGFDYQILGTDICTTVLRSGRRAIYPETMATQIPAPLRQRYLLRSRNRDERLVRIVPALRRKVEFAHLNFMAERYRLPHQQDIIFCRNVLIYFEPPVQLAVLSRLCACLDSGGALFIGHSETLNGLELPLKAIAPTVYLKL